MEIQKRTENSGMKTTFGRWTVIGDAPSSASGNKRVHCRCQCGTVRIVQLRHLLSGQSQSCQCRQKEIVSVTNSTHGHTRGGKESVEYRTWQGLLSRVRATKGRIYRLYGARGITACDRWQVFENFLADMGQRPSPKHSIDRRNNDGNYEPGNCWWATRSQQVHNRRSPVLWTRVHPSRNRSGVRGVFIFRNKFRSQICHNHHIYHLGLFDDIASARDAYEAARIAIGDGTFRDRNGRRIPA